MDDDSFLNVPEFVTIMRKKKAFTEISGFMNHNPVPIRWAWNTATDESWKWVCPEWMCKDEKFPPYLSGIG